MNTNLNFFVYGTLKPGEVNHWVCAPYIATIQPAIVSGRLYHLPFGYPAVTIEEDGIVQGYLCSFTASKIVSILDEFEQHDPQTFEHLAPGRAFAANQYSRKLLTIFTPKRSRLGYAWGYVMTREQIRCLSGQWVPGGIWSSRSHPSITL